MGAGIGPRNCASLTLVYSNRRLPNCG
jgi:hypothetical protein